MKDSLFLDACRMNYDAIFVMLDEIIKLCPDDLWNVRTDEPPFWQQLYHTIFYTDFYIRLCGLSRSQPLQKRKLTISNM
jgi:hypothetical protein